MTEHYNDRPDEQDKHYGDEGDLAVNADHSVGEGTEFTHDSTAFGDDTGAAFTSDDGDVSDPGDSSDNGNAGDEGRHDTLDGSARERATQEQLQNLRKVAEDTAYAAVGFVGLVSDKAKEFYEVQRKQYAEAHPDADAEHGAKNFLAQLKEQLDKLIEDVNRSFRDLADRGRSSSAADRSADKAESPASDTSSATGDVEGTDEVFDVGAGVDGAPTDAEGFEEGAVRPNEF